MDFTDQPETDDARELAAGVFARLSTPERLRGLDESARAGGDRFDEALWSGLADAGLLGLALPESAGGAGLGVIEACAVLTEAGRTAAAVPLAAHTAAALTLARAGGHDRLVAGAADGSVVLSAAVTEDRAPVASAPGTTADAAGRLTGAKTLVPASTRAAAFLVPATAGEDVAVFVVERDAEGLRIQDQRTSDGDTVGLLTLSGTPATRLDVDPDFLFEHLQVCVAAWQLGLLEGAQSLTAAYARTREQFGRPIGTFQAVSQRLADGYIDILGARLTLLQAAWRLAEGLPAAREVEIARLWAADAGHSVAHTTVHVHGGVGIDLDGEAHRYFTGLKRTELTLGGAGEQARALGARLAAAN